MKDLQQLRALVLSEPERRAVLAELRSLLSPALFERIEAMLEQGCFKKLSLIS